MAENVDILGKGWRFPFAITKRKGGPGTSASLSESEGIEHVKESIRQILGTPIGSRVMRRDFGSRLRQIVFQPNDSTIDTLVEHYVREAIERWERRALVGSVTVVHDERELGKVEIGVEFRIIQTNVLGNLVFPYYLAGSGQGGGGTS
ncbi:GPW/gp25 family protein [bacterium]|nr:GPW/gp25 family protein [bacterium]